MAIRTSGATVAAVIGRILICLSFHGFRFVSGPSCTSHGMFQPFCLQEHFSPSLSRSQINLSPNIASHCVAHTCSLPSCGDTLNPQALTPLDGPTSRSSAISSDIDEIVVAMSLCNGEAFEWGLRLLYRTELGGSVLCASSAREHVGRTDCLMSTSTKVAPSDGVELTSKGGVRGCRAQDSTAHTVVQPSRSYRERLHARMHPRRA